VRSFFRDGDRHRLIGRLASLTPGTPARWGAFDAPRMVAHLTQSLRMATGDLPVGFHRTVLRFPLIKHLAIYLLPLPKGLPTAPELLAREPAHWDADVAALQEAMEIFARRPRATAWPVHPVFGPMTSGQWAVQQYRHCDHHLRQFGA
jgi:hypothetical protein